METSAQPAIKTTRLDNLAETINREHEACERSVRAGLEHAIRVGEVKH
jgi:hypothetical protein